MEISGDTAQMVNRVIGRILNFLLIGAVLEVVGTLMGKGKSDSGSGSGGGGGPKDSPKGSEDDEFAAPADGFAAGAAKKGGKKGGKEGKEGRRGSKDKVGLSPMEQLWAWSAFVQEHSSTVGGLLLIILLFGLKAGEGSFKSRGDSSELNPYTVLGLNSYVATQRDIKAAYRKLSVEWHPDKHVENVEL